MCRSLAQRDSVTYLAVERSRNAVDTSETENLSLLYLPCTVHASRRSYILPVSMHSMHLGASMVTREPSIRVSKAHREIEVFRLSLRDTVNEGDDTTTTTTTKPAIAARVNSNDGEPVALSTTDVTPSSSTTTPVSSASASASAPVSVSTPPPPPAPQKPPLQSTPGYARESQRVVLVTRPSQREIEQWTERATSTMVRSSGGTVRFVTPTRESRRWVLEYKPVVRHSGWLIKRGHSIRNFKRRLFCIIDHELVYHDTHDSTDVRGRIDLRKKTTVQCLLQSGFSLCQGSYQMILYATDQHDRDTWIKNLLEQGVELLPASAKTTKLVEQQSSKLVFSGWLRKRGQMVKSTKRRWFELSESTLSYYAHPEGGTKKGTLDVTNARISHLDTLKTGERFSFVVRTPQRDLVLHADSQEERSLWVASLSSVAEGVHSSASSDSSQSFSRTLSFAGEIGRRCSCGTGSLDEGSAVGTDSACRRCMSSFISKTEDALVDVTREVQLILASPYSPEGSTSAAFLKEHTGRAMDNAALKQFMSGLSDYMVHTRLNELRVLGGRYGGGGGSPVYGDDSGANGAGGGSDDDDSAEFTEHVLTIINEQIEERVFFPLYRAAHDTIKEQVRADSKLLQGKIEVLQSKAQSFFGIGPDSQSASDWKSAAASLKEIDKLSLPYMKRNQIVAACKEIYNVYHSEHPTSAPMSADDFIPAFIYVLVQSRLSDPVLLKEMVTFFDLGGTQGEAAYFVTCLEIAIEYIRSLVIACTVVMDTTQKLGIEFARDPIRHIIVVNRLIPNGQAEQSQAVHVGDVLVAINGVLVYEMELSEITKMVTGIEGDAELCLLSMAEYERRYGTAKRAFCHDDDDDDDDDDDGDANEHDHGASYHARTESSDNLEAPATIANSGL